MSEAAYLEIVRALQQEAKKAKRVTQDDVLDIASMPVAELCLRALRARDWHKAYANSLDGIPEIYCIGGGGIDGCRMPENIRSVVLELLRHSNLTFKDSYVGKLKSAQQPAGQLAVARIISAAKTVAEKDEINYHPKADFDTLRSALAALGVTQQMGRANG